jgi:magnesium chelatase family protein
MTIDYPAAFMLIAAMNPCPCGYYNHPTVACTCPPGAVKKYLNKVSGPLMDRIDLHIEVTPVPVSQLNSMQQGESSAVIRQRVIAARAIQTARFAGHPGVHCNAQMTSKLTREHCQLSEECRSIIEAAMNRLGLSARAYDRILRVSRTIADLEGSAAIQPHHLQEAITYRSLDRDSWGK